MHSEAIGDFVNITYQGNSQLCWLSYNKKIKIADHLIADHNAVAAVSEFVDETFGILAEAEDADAMVEGIAELYEHPEFFQAMSKAAAERVRRQSSSQIIIQKELEMFLHE